MNTSAVHPRCAHCGTEITGFTIYWQDEKSYHPECFNSAMEPPKMTESVRACTVCATPYGQRHKPECPAYDHTQAKLEDQAATIERLQARLAEVEGDAKRLDWLDTCRHDITSEGRDGRGEWYQTLIGHGWSIEGQFSSVREAIDAIAQEAG